VALDTLLDMNEHEDRFTDPAYRAGVIDLLGTLAYGELSAFLRLASDAELAPTLTAKAALAGLAATEFGHYEQLRDRLIELGADPEVAMRPFIAPLDAFHERTRPSTWLEGLVKFFVGDGIASDFYREISSFLDDGTRQLVLGAVDSGAQATFVVQEVRAAIAIDPTLASRLALWGRRLVGEALSQGQRVAADRETFSTLVVGTDEHPGMGLVGIIGMFGRITERHTQRMAEMGLSA
jgi:tRNA-(MS[2]IO[6]A)-hydroxylase (MiaE)-like